MWISSRKEQLEVNGEALARNDTPAMVNTGGAVKVAGVLLEIICVAYIRFV